MVSAHRGFTLVELLITLALIAIVALAAVPYTTAWINTANVQTSAASLEQAFAKAKALALRNPAGVSVGTPAASVKLVGNNLIVCSGAPGDAGCAVAGGNMVWLGNVTDGVAIQWGGAGLSSVLFDNSGQAVDGNGNPLAILDLSVRKGDVSYDAHLY